MNNFSPNMLKTFKDCPQKYYLKYVKKISVPQKSTPFEKGKKIHALANYYLRGDDITKLETALTQEEFAVWEALKSNEFFQKTYINSEYQLYSKIDGFWIGGRLDALVKSADDYYILDYKTGSIPKTPEFDYQTMVYLLAVDKLIKNYNSLTFVYIDLKNNQNHKIEFTKELAQKYSAEIKRICTEINSTHNFQCSRNACKFCEYNKFC